ncbi:MAG: Wzz/FepE/Etk N-terminal domain-containing protein [Candidatus Sumerlaeia bacterium]|nr:Wzz/FepE/Etk N-terminal domain-containing protein [Candidatus Sumerlaeia bacterium]
MPMTQALPPDSVLVTLGDLLRHLWRRRYLALGAPAALVVLTYLFLKFLAGENFQATATVMVRPPAAALRSGPNLGSLEVPSYKDILTNDELVRSVVDAARGRFADDLGDAKFEELKRNFSVRVVTTRDTSVQTTFSPVLEMTVKGPSPDAALFMMQQWLDGALARYGGLFSDQMRDVAEASSEKATGAIERLGELRRKEQELSRRLELVDTVISSKYRLLDSGYGETGLVFNLDMAEPSEGLPQASRSFSFRGLMAEQARLELRIAELEGRPEDGTGAAELAGVRSRLERSNELIAQIGADLEALASRSAELRGEYEAAKASAGLAEQAVEALSEIAARAAADQTLVVGDGSAAKGDLRVLSSPVLPEKRVGFSRVLTAIAAGTAFFVFLLLLFSIEIALARVLQSDKSANA